MKEETIEYIPGTTLPQDMPADLKKFWKGTKPSKQTFCDSVEFWNKVYEKYDFDASKKDALDIWEYWRDAFGK